jgi:chromosome transmission fidelity protein 4
MHWRKPGQAKWVPLLATAQLDRLVGSRRAESYWPVAVAQEKFHCIILKGDYPYPSHPTPHLTEFDFKVPVGSRLAEDANEKDESDLLREKNGGSAQLEESFVRNSVLLSLAQDFVSPDLEEPHPRISECGRRLVELDKILLQLLAVECREGEDRGMKALDIVGLMQDRGAKLVEAAAKVAGRWGRELLVDKIEEMGESWA